MRANDVMTINEGEPSVLYFDPEILAEGKATFTTKPNGEGKVYIAEALTDTPHVTSWSVYDLGNDRILHGHTAKGQQ